MGGTCFQLQLCGMMIYYSIMQGGPSFPFLASWVYDYLIEGETVGYNQGPSTADLLRFVNKLDEVQTDEDINNILEKSNPSAASYWQ